MNNKPTYRAFSSSQKICAYLFPLFIIYSIYVFYLSIYSILFISIFFQRQPLFWFVVLSILELHLRRIIQYVLFCVCFLLLNLASVTFTHVTVTISTTLLFYFFQYNNPWIIDMKYSIVQRCQNLFIHSFVDGHLDLFQFGVNNLTIMNKAVKNIIKFFCAKILLWDECREFCEMNISQNTFMEFIQTYFCGMKITTKAFPFFSLKCGLSLNLSCSCDWVWSILFTRNDPV